jgi:hypothetical protein
MEFFTGGFFWFIEGILFTIMLLAFRAWAQDRAIPMPYWKWIALGAWVLLAGFTIAFIGTSLGENEPTAAVRGGILFGVIVVISGAGVWRLLMIGAGSSEHASEAGS